MEMLLTIGGIIYGCLLILTVFIKTRFTEAFRIDAIISSTPSEQTRPVNLVAGILFAGYSIYTLF